MSPSDSDDARFEAPVKALTPDARGQLQGLLDALDGCERFAEADPEDLLYVSYAPEVHALLRWCSANRVMVPFDWGAWDEGRGLTPEAIAGRPLADAVRLLTAVIRNDRFSSGALGNALENGIIQACLRRMLAS